MKRFCSPTVFRDNTFYLVNTFKLNPESVFLIFFTAYFPATGHRIFRAVTSNVSRPCSPILRPYPSGSYHQCPDLSSYVTHQLQCRGAIQGKAFWKIWRLTGAVAGSAGPAGRPPMPRPLTMHVTTPMVRTSAATSTNNNADDTETTEVTIKPYVIVK